MKGLKKLVISAMAICLALVASVANVSALTTTAGETVTVTFEYNNVESLEGKLTYTDDNGIIESIKITGANFPNGSVNYTSDGAWMTLSNMEVESVSGTITVTAVVKASAQAGQKAYVYFTGGYTPDNGDYVENGIKDTEIIEIVATTPDTPDNPDTPDTPDTPSKPSTGGSSTGGTSQGTIDYTELEKQIEIAEGLNQKEYTEESWNEMMKALAEARNHLRSNSQKAVDDAAKALADAIAALVKMDYSKLEAALGKADEFIKDTDGADVWQKFFDAIANGKDMLNSNNQADVDAAAKAIEDALQELLEYLGLGTTYCNVPFHKVWPILFFISLVGNIAMGYMLVQKKKKNTFKDNTPVVDYDINDDN